MCVYVGLTAVFDVTGEVLCQFDRSVHWTSSGHFVFFIDSTQVVSGQ